jgi:hypothetical protein
MVRIERICIDTEKAKGGIRAVIALINAYNTQISISEVSIGAGLDAGRAR